MTRKESRSPMRFNYFLNVTNAIIQLIITNKNRSHGPETISF